MVKFGVAGYPLAFGESAYRKERLQIFRWLRELGLDAFEAQMTYGPRTKKENCLAMKERAAEWGITLSVHAAYYIVLTSADKAKIKRSEETLARTYELAGLMGADKVVLHPGPLYSEPPAVVLDRLGENLAHFLNGMGGTEIRLYLETAGKKGQLGSVDEILSLTDKLAGCYPCIDFGHVHARTCGSLATGEAIDALFGKLEQAGVFREDHAVHFHYTPIDYGGKGEITHKALEDRYPESEQPLLDFLPGEEEAGGYYHPRFERIIENMSALQCDFTVISETHNSQEQGGRAMKAHYRELTGA